MKKAFITGTTGQDGAYLSQLLLDKGYEVHGLKRRVSILHTDRVDHLYSNANFKLHYGDLTDATSILRLIQEIKPDEIYNLAAQSHVHVSFSEPEYTGNADGLGCLRILEAIRIANIKCKFYQAGTSEMYGRVLEIPQKETTPFNPVSPYGSAKVYAYYITKNYRESYNMFACTGILFNHESPLRGETFVTRKITRHVASIVNGNTLPLFLGNLNSLRDWGHAKDYVIAMWKMLQQETPTDYVISTGKQYSVRDFVELAYSEIGINIKWKGSGLNEIGYDIETNKELIYVDNRYFRPNEVDTLLGDSTKAKKELNWEPTISFSQLVKEMVHNDIQCIHEHKKFII